MMVVRAFPPVTEADENGLLCVGGDLDPETLLLSYKNGIFPWPLGEQSPLLWFSPPLRAVLFVHEAKVSRSLRRESRRHWSYSVNQSFSEIISGCRETPRGKRGSDTWITAEMLLAYSKLHSLGYCHSVEVWKDGSLAGGLYGVAIGSMFAGESMFHRVPNASKLALCYLLETMKERGGMFIDCQQLTPLLASFGAREIPRDEFLEHLSQSISEPMALFHGQTLTS